MSQQTIDADKVYKGTVKWFNPTKGFGFIAPDDSDDENGGGSYKNNNSKSSDVFVHITALHKDSEVDNLVEGQKIRYSLETDRKSGKVSAVKLKKG